MQARRVIELTVIHLQRKATSRTVLFCSSIAIFAYRIMFDSEGNLQGMYQGRIIWMKEPRKN